ncbi:hypothetical protein FBY35_5099 [Streptomyces sp. SLBN-118]|nr:hypothetical protein FBY35_5099 [Streptomyces sp. SLBN-118]
MPGPQIDEQGIHQEATAPQVHEPAAPPAYEPAAQAPLGVQRVPTGNAGVDVQLERLADADHLPADGHLEVYEDVHRGLRDALTALDARPAPVPAGPLPSPSYNHRS